MKKKQIIPLCLFLLLIAIVPAFFTNHKQDPIESMETAYVPPDLSGQKLTMLAIQPHMQSTRTLAKWFNEETGAVVETRFVNYEDLLDTVKTDVTSANPQLDVFMYWYVNIGTLVKYDAVLDLTDFIIQNQHVLQPTDYITNLYDSYTLYDGKRWSLPFDGDTHVLFYRKSLLNKYNLSPPETWDQYFTNIRVITQEEKSNGIYGAAVMASPVPIIIVSSFMNRLGGYGGQLFDENNQPTLNSNEALKALNALIKHTEYALPTALETNFEVSRDAFLSGRVAMVEQWTDIGIMAENPRQSLIQKDWGVVQIPRGSDAKIKYKPALNGGFGLAISSRAQNLEAAKAFLLFSSFPTTTLRLNLVNGGIDPTRISVLKSEKYRDMVPELSRAVNAALENATAWPTAPEAPDLLAVLSNNLALAIEGHKTAKKALDDTQEQWINILKIKK